MTKAVRVFTLIAFCLALVSSLFVTGCTRYANEEQLTTLDETEAAAVAGEERIAELEREKTELEAKLEAKKAELEQVKQEKEKVQSKMQ
jgi:multidrug resistance efflux pump